jgi:hypothetical protein
VNTPCAKFATKPARAPLVQPLGREIEDSEEDSMGEAVLASL